MSLWKRLFGGETPEQRLSRAREHLAEDEPELAVRTIAALDGADAEALRVEALAAIARREAEHAPVEVLDRVEVDEADREDEPIQRDRRPLVRPGASRGPSRIQPPVTREALRVQLTSGAIGGMFASSVAARPLGDAVQMLVMDMQGAAELTLNWADLDALGLTRDEAFALGRRNSLEQVMHGMHMQPLAVAGATCELAVSNDFYLGGAMLEMRDHMPPGSPQIVCPLTWHHWLVFELAPDATRDTLAAMNSMVGQIADGITTIRNVSAWVTRSLWWWPTGAPLPEVLDPSAPQAAVIARLN